MKLSARLILLDKVQCKQLQCIMQKSTMYIVIDSKFYSSVLETILNDCRFYWLCIFKHEHCNQETLRTVRWHSYLFFLFFFLFFLSFFPIPIFCVLFIVTPIALAVHFHAQEKVNKPWVSCTKLVTHSLQVLYYQIRTRTCLFFRLYEMNEKII